METNRDLELVWGVKAISRLIGRTERQTFYMLAAGQLPAKQVGERWVVERRALERFFSMEAA